MQLGIFKGKTVKNTYYNTDMYYSRYTGTEIQKSRQILKCATKFI